MKTSRTSATTHAPLDSASLGASALPVLAVFPCHDTGVATIVTDDSTVQNEVTDALTISAADLIRWIP